MEPKPTYDVKCATIPAPELHERWWLSFEPDDDLTQCAARFVRQGPRTARVHRPHADHAARWPVAAGAAPAAAGC